MTISPWLALGMAVPVLLLGEYLVGRVRVLDRFNIPAPVAGGLLVALAVLLGNVTGLCDVRFQTDVTARGWTWLVCTGEEWSGAPAKPVTQPLLVAFFACIGLNASWTLLKRGCLQVLLFLGLAAALAVLQNLIGVGVAAALGLPPLLGLMCGSVALTGGHGTVMVFAPEFQAAGLTAASVTGVAAATFGLVAGGLLGGPVGGALIRKGNLLSLHPHEASGGHGGVAKLGLVADLCALSRHGWRLLAHGAVLLACVKLGAWVSCLIQKTGLTFPVYMGSMLLGVAVRNAVDCAFHGRPRPEIFDGFASVSLGLFLTVAMMSLNLGELVGVAHLMLVILAVQTAALVLFVRVVTFRVMGGDYDAAVMAAGQCGFGLGAMPTAMANMQALTEHHGPAPRAFLVVPITGSFLVDLVNAANITVFINGLK
jgi:ESS family glutamate:Na+ symporter